MLHLNLRIKIEYLLKSWEFELNIIKYSNNQNNGWAIINVPFTFFEISPLFLKLSSQNFNCVCVWTSLIKYDQNGLPWLRFAKLVAFLLPVTLKSDCPNQKSSNWELLVYRFKAYTFVIIKPFTDWKSVERFRSYGQKSPKFDRFLEKCHFCHFWYFLSITFERIAIFSRNFNSRLTT